MKRIEIEHNGEALEVHYDYQPEEKQTRDYPGCHEEVEINEIFFNGISVFNLLADKSDELENKVLDKLNEIKNDI